MLKRYSDGKRNDCFLVYKSIPTSIKAETFPHLELVVTILCTHILVGMVEKHCDKQLWIAICFVSFSLLVSAKFMRN